VSVLARCVPEPLRIGSCLFRDFARSVLDAKASIALDGMIARPVNDPKIASKDPDCFEVTSLMSLRLPSVPLGFDLLLLHQVHHQRRRTYFLRPAKSSGAVDAKQSSEYWIRAINAAITSIGHPFAQKFKSPKFDGK
jgi:hypothetical protein